jgi:hypothetical protein
MNPSQLSLPPSERRFAAVAATVLVHAALIVVWQAARQVPLPDGGEPLSFVQWVRLAERVPVAPALEKTADETRRAPVVDGAAARPPLPAQTRRDRTAWASERIGERAATVLTAPAADGLDATPPAATPTVTAPSDSARQILERARRDSGAIDRALRKENSPFIVAPLDSPQIRMRRKIGEAAAVAPNRLWEAPKMEELVNDTGDGARRTRVITGGGTYCVTERSPATSIDMIEKHGKRRITNCGQGHEQPASAQEWRTARD